MEIQAELDFVPLTEDLIFQVIDIHSQAFAGQMNVRLGRRYLFHFFKWFIDYPTSISVVAKDKKNNVHGYVIAAPLGYDFAMNRDLFWVAAGSLVSHPSLWVNQNIQSAVIDRARTLFGFSNHKVQYPELPLPAISLVGIGVAPQSQNGRIGLQLMRIFEGKSKVREMKSMRLSVYPENRIARRLYEKCGWSAFLNGVQPKRAMFYYKVISAA